ncbi:MAG: hypothetical protein ACHQ7M_10270 [Chloroflexota bacterium]
MSAACARGVSCATCLRCCEAIHQEQIAGDRGASETPPSPAVSAVRAGPGEGRDEGTRRTGSNDLLFGYAASAGCYLAGAGDSARGTHLRRFGELLGSAAAAKALSAEGAEAFRAGAAAALEGSDIAAEHLAALRSLADYVLDTEI